MTKQSTIDIEPDYTAIKAKQNVAWASGDYSQIGQTIQIVGETLAEAMDIRAGQKVLDVAAGSGNFSLAAARRWAEVTSSDYVASLLDKGRQRAAADGLDIAFDVADAENLPYADASFDVVGSTFGVMFAPNQNTAAAEMVRVCRSGGKIALANWTPEGFVGSLFKTVGAYVAPPPGVNPPALWGTEAFIADRFDTTASGIEINRRNFVFRYRSADHFLDIFRNFYGPVHKAFLAIDETGQAALARDLNNVLDARNTAQDGTLVIPGEYLEIVVKLK